MTNSLFDTTNLLEIPAQFTEMSSEIYIIYPAVTMTNLI
jgi:hypothetical protein